MNNVNNIPLKKRRLDSFAWILQGDSTCAACYFDKDEKKLLFATNYELAGDVKLNFGISEEQKEIITQARQNRLKTKNSFDIIKSYLKEIAEISYEMSKYLSSDVNFLHSINNSTEDKIKQEEIQQHNLSIIKKYNKLKKQCKDKMDTLFLTLETSTKMFKNSDYKSAFYKALKKITKSIRHTYLYPNSKKSLDIDVVNALKDEKIELLTPEGYKPKASTLALHAEMIIIEYLYSKKKIGQNNEIYIGISKQCCLNCEIAIKAINNIYKSKMIDDKYKIKGDEGEDEEVNFYPSYSLYSRGNHGYVFPCVCPNFLSNNQDLKDEYIKIFKQHIQNSTLNNSRFTYKNKNNTIDISDIGNLKNILDVFQIGEIKKAPGRRMLHIQSVSDGSSNISDETIMYRRRRDPTSAESAMTDDSADLTSPKKRPTRAASKKSYDDMRVSEIDDYSDEKPTSNDPESDKLDPEKVITIEDYNEDKDNKSNKKLPSPRK